MLKKILVSFAVMVGMIAALQFINPVQAEAKDVWAYTAPNQEYSIYVISEYVRTTDVGTLKCRTKTVRGVGYDLTGWEFKRNGDVYYYRVCEDQGKNGLVPVEGKWYVLNDNEMINVYNTCIDCLN